MTVTAKALAEIVAEPAAETTLYLAPASTRTIIDKLTATNTTVAAIAVTIKLVPFGQVAGTPNIVVVTNLAIGATYTFPEVTGHVLNTGDFISVLAAAIGVNFRASGREVN